MTTVGSSSTVAPVAGGAVSMAGLDPEAVIGVVSMQISDAQVGQAQNRAQSLSTDRDTALRKARHALQQAAKKKRDGGAFSGLVDKLKVVAEVAGIVASVAAMCTGVGTAVGAVCLAGILMSGVGLGMQVTGKDVNLGSVKIFGAKINVSLSETLMLAGAVATGGAGAAGGAASTAANSAGTAGQAASTATEAASTAGRAASVAADAAKTAQTVGTMGRLLTYTKYAADAGQVGSLGFAAYYTVRAGQAKGAAVDLEADAKSDQVQADQAKSDFEDQVDLMRGAMASRSRAANAVGQILAEHAQDMRTLNEGIRA